MPAIALIRGAGDLASGVALRLVRAGLGVVMTELAAPLAVRRSVSFAEAIYEGAVSVEGIEGRRIEDPSDTLKILSSLTRHRIPVLVDPECTSANSLHPLVIIDGRMTKRPPDPLRHSAALYLGLGPGFRAPDNCHAVIETERGHTLGRVIWNGSGHDDTAAPEGDARRVLRAPESGSLDSAARIGEHFDEGEQIAVVADQPISAPFGGMLRGIIRPGTQVEKGMKIGDIDPRDDPLLWQLVSDKSLAVAGGVLEAILTRAEVRSKLWA